VLIGQLEINRAIATRYDQRPETFLSIAHIAAAIYGLECAPVA